MAHTSQRKNIYPFGRQFKSGETVLHCVGMVFTAEKCAFIFMYFIFFHLRGWAVLLRTTLLWHTSEDLLFSWVVYLTVKCDFVFMFMCKLWCKTWRIIVGAFLVRSLGFRSGLWLVKKCLCWFRAALYVVVNAERWNSSSSIFKQRS